MRKDAVGRAYRRKVISRAQGRCEYCQSPDALSVGSFHIDHIIPLVHKGATRFENLAYCCPSCNNTKWSKMKGRDPKTNRLVNLFNPRRQKWQDHFNWSPDGAHIEGKTPCGRTTIEALEMNRPHVVKLRQVWVTWGEHPPTE